VTTTGSNGCTAGANGIVTVLASPPAISPTQSACADSQYTFIYSNVTAGIGADQIEWATNSRFDSSTVASSPANISLTVLAGNSDTIWLRSRNSATGCIGDSIISIATTYPFPLSPNAYPQDTLLQDTFATIIIPNSQVGITYNVQLGSSVVASAYGTGYGLSITAAAPDSATVFLVSAIDSAVMCSSHTNSVVNVYLLPSPPDVPPIQSAISDSAYTFTFANVTAGRGGDKIEWATNYEFNSSTIVSSPTDISITVQPGSSSMIWLRTRNSSTGQVSRRKSTMATNNRRASSTPTYVSLNTPGSMAAISSSPPSGYVGETPGYHNTTPTGAVTYTIPIAIPSGTNNMAPKISLEYNSQSGSNHMGWGWNIGGLSSISRAGLNNYYDGQTGPITYTNTDHFLLDGQILVPLNGGSNGAAGTTYGKQSEDYSITTSLENTSLSTGGLYFTVVTKQGLTYEYGYTADSRIMSNDPLSISQNIIAWRVDKITDQDGNYVLFKYDNQSSDPNYKNDPRIIEIDYTGNTNQNTEPYNQILFNYTARSDVNAIYTAGSEMDFNYLLTSINVTGNQQSFKTYNLAYGADDLSSYLVSVTEQGTNPADGSAAILKPTLFEYGTANPLTNYTSNSAFTFPLNPSTNYYQTFFPVNSYKILNQRLISGDFNGDGYSDMLAIGVGQQPILDQYYIAHNLFYDVYFNNPLSSNSFNRVDEFDHPLDDITFANAWNNNGAYVINSNKPYGSSIYSLIVTQNGDYHYYVGDFLGIGRDGILEIGKAFNNQDYNGSVITDAPPPPLANLQIDSIHYSTYSNAGVRTRVSFPLPPVDNVDFAQSPEHWFYQGDFDGDGIQDYIIITNKGAYISFPGKGNGIFNKLISQPQLQPPGGAIPAECDYWLNLSCPNTQINVIDFDGDGKSDLFIANKASSSLFLTPQVVTIVSDGQGGYTLKGIQSVNLGLASMNTWSINGFYFGDFNGDGKTDILTRNYSNGSNAQVLDPVSMAQVDNLSINDNQVSAPIMTTSGTATWNIWYSTGTTYVPTTANINTTVEAYTTYDPIIADFNGDGKSDILMSSSHLSPGTYNNLTEYFINNTDLSMYYSTGKGLKEYSLASGQSGLYAGFTVMGDFNGDGQADVSFYNVAASGTDNISGGATSLLQSIDEGIYAASPQYENDYYQFSFNPKSQNRLMQKVLDGFDQLKAFTYTLLTDPHGIHQRGTNATYPLISVQPAMNVVSEISVPDGVGGFNVTDYNYQDAKAHIGGRGFLGFSVANTIFNFNGTQSYVYSNFNAPFTNDNGSTVPYVPVPYLSGNYFSGSNIPNSQAQRSYAIVPLGNASPTGIPRFAVQKVQDINNNELTGAVTTISYTYDNFGNITTQSTNVNNTEWTNVFAQYVPTGIVTIPNQPSSVATIKSRSGAQVYADGTSYQYNSPAGHVTQKITGVGKACGITYTMGYDPFGNMNIQTSKLSNYTARTQKYEYDLSNGRLLKNWTNTLGQTEIYTYDNFTQLWGKPWKDQTIDGLITSYTYDAFGRTAQVASPRGFNINSTYAWDIANSGTPSVYKVSTVQPGAPATTVWYDALGRQVITTQQGFENPSLGANQGLLTTTTTYNNHGKVTETDGPYYSGQLYSYKKTTYDNLDHPRTITDQFGTTNIAYWYPGDGTVIEDIADPALRSSEKIIDATGKLIQASDNGGVLTYKYDSYGNQTEVDMGTQVLLSSQYDECEHPSGTTEPNSGKYTYQYDGYGELIAQTDANQNSYVMAYDVAGRTTLRNGPEGSTYYNYVPTGQNGVNKILNVTETTGAGQSYTYDGFSQVKTATDIVPVPSWGTGSYTTSYSYDVYGNVKSTIYPSTVEIDYTYDPTTSYLLSISDHSTSSTLYSVYTMDQYGHATYYTTGNGAISTLTTHYGVPTDYLTINGSSGSPIQNLSLLYDWPSRDLKYRTDNILGLEEAFNYDASDRLITSQVNCTNPSGLCSVYPQMNYSYTSNGNLQTKTDVGTYYYDPTKINAVHKVTNSEINISTNTQSITYTGFNATATITEGQYELDYSYGPDYARKLSLLKQNGTIIESHLYSGSYEIYHDNTTGNEVDLHYIYGNNGLVAIVAMDQSGTHDYYTYTDQLGSILTVTDNTGSPVAQQNFDAWGRNRNPADWTYTNVPSSGLPWLYRGYTGHEMLPQFALINMNGRLYDPLLGRMLRPDNVIHDPSNTQSYNRYSYVSNNPTKYTDPTGWDFGDGQSYEDWIGGIVQSGGGAYLGDGFQGSGPSFSSQGYMTAGVTTYSPNGAYVPNAQLLSGESSPDDNIISKGNVLQSKTMPDGSKVYVYQEDGTGNLRSVAVSPYGGAYSFIDPMTAFDAMLKNSSVSAYSYNMPASASNQSNSPYMPSTTSSESYPLMASLGGGSLLGITPYLKQVDQFMTKLDLTTSLINLDAEMNPQSWSNISNVENGAKFFGWGVTAYNGVSILAELNEHSENIQPHNNFDIALFFAGLSGGPPGEALSIGNLLFSNYTQAQYGVTGSTYLQQNNLIPPSSVQMSFQFINMEINCWHYWTK
jgi:RHS repeat-associated protein